MVQEAFTRAAGRELGGGLLQLPALRSAGSEGLRAGAAGGCGGRRRIRGCRAGPRCPGPVVRPARALVARPGHPRFRRPYPVATRTSTARAPRAKMGNPPRHLGGFLRCGRAPARVTLLRPSYLPMSKEPSMLRHLVDRGFADEPSIRSVAGAMAAAIRAGLRRAGVANRPRTTRRRPGPVPATTGHRDRLPIAPSLGAALADEHIADLRREAEAARRARAASASRRNGSGPAVDPAARSPELRAARGGRRGGRRRPSR
jgi:hypothetical protein